MGEFMNCNMTDYEDMMTTTSKVLQVLNYCHYLIGLGRLTTTVTAVVEKYRELYATLEDEAIPPMITTTDPEDSDDNFECAALQHWRNCNSKKVRQTSPELPGGSHQDISRSSAEANMEQQPTTDLASPESASKRVTRSATRTISVSRTLTFAASTMSEDGELEVQPKSCEEPPAEQSSETHKAPTAGSDQ